MPTMATYKCKECSKPFEARTADRARGWARFCSKSCKAVKQTKKGTRRRSRFPRHDGKSPMKFKNCCVCGDAAVNGVHTITGIDWLCEAHMAEGTTHPFSCDALGQW